MTIMQAAPLCHRAAFKKVRVSTVRIVFYACSHCAYVASVTTM